MATAVSTSAQKIYFNPFDPAFRANPYPSYVALRSGPPRTLKLFMPIVMVARYADVVAVLQDHDRFSANPQALFVNEGYAGTRNMLTSMLNDPPIHTRIRRAVAPQFTPKRVAEWEPRIREITIGMLDRIEQKGSFDVLADLADPLPTVVLSEIFGVPAEDYPRFKNWSDRITESVHIMPGVPQPDYIREAFVELRAYLSDLIERKRSKPVADLLSELVQKEDEDKLTTDELLDFVIMQLLAGTDTTTNTMGNGFLAMMRNRDQLEPAPRATFSHRQGDRGDLALRRADPRERPFRARGCRGGRHADPQRRLGVRDLRLCQPRSRAVRESGPIRYH